MRRSAADLDPVVADACEAADDLIERIGRHPNGKAPVTPGVEGVSHGVWLPIDGI